MYIFVCDHISNLEFSEKTRSRVVDILPAFVFTLIFHKNNQKFFGKSI